MYTNAAEYLKIDAINEEKVVCCGFKEGMSQSDVIIPEGVTEIADYAFNDNAEIVRVHCPDSITKIGECAFQSCYALEEIQLPQNMNGVFGTMLNDCPKLRKVAIPQGITQIAPCALNGDESLTELSIPNTVTKIGWGAFTNCSSLETLYIPDSVTEINMAGTFAFCSALTSIRLPENLTFLWEYDCGDILFFACDSLKTLTIGSRDFAYDTDRFQRFEKRNDPKKECSDSEMKAMLRYCCDVHDTETLPSLFEVEQDCYERIKAFADRYA